MFSNIIKKLERNYICLPFINKTISWSIFNTPIHKTIGITNIVHSNKLPKNKKHFTIFLEYDHTTKNTIIKKIKNLHKIIPFKNAYFIKSRPNQNNRWHVIIPEIFTEGEWLTALAESGCDDSYKSMSIKRGYSVLRISEKKDIPKPKYAFKITFSQPQKRLESSWHAEYLKKAYGITSHLIQLRTTSKIIGYKTGHFD